MLIQEGVASRQINNVTKKTGPARKKNLMFFLVKTIILARGKY
jgi:hypothetical protein